MKTAILTSLSILGLSLTLFSCGGGGGGGVGSSGGNGNHGSEGAYSAEEFGYEDPHPASFHPLGTSSTVLRQRSELGLFTFGFDTKVGMLDDAGTGYALTDMPARFFAADTGVLAVASGNVDDDAAHEMVVVTNTNGRAMLRVEVLERQPNGGEFERFVAEQIQIIGQDAGLLVETAKSVAKVAATRSEQLSSERRRIQQERRRLEGQRGDLLRVVPPSADEAKPLLDEVAQIDDRLRELGLGDRRSRAVFAAGVQRDEKPYLVGAFPPYRSKFC